MVGLSSSMRHSKTFTPDSNERLANEAHSLRLHSRTHFIFGKLSEISLSFGKEKDHLIEEEKEKKIELAGPRDVGTLVGLRQGPLSR